MKRKKLLITKTLIVWMKKILLCLSLLFLISFAYSFCEDSDGDNYGIKELDCGFSALDCDDFNPNINPGKTEVCSNGIDEDCNGKDLSCMQCAEGEIFFRCSCQGKIYEKGTGYCCNNVFNETKCEPGCTGTVADRLNCITEQGCPGETMCNIWLAPPHQLFECHDVFPDDNCPCIEKWSCENWSSCINGKTTRKCTDKKNCSTIKIKPKTTSTCTTETKKISVKLLKNTIKENELITLIASYNNNPLVSAKVEYSGKSILTDFSGKAVLTAVFGQNKIKVSKQGFDSEELTINVIKEIDAGCGNNYCDEKENEFNCPIDCKKTSETGDQNKDDPKPISEEKQKCGNKVCDKGEGITNCFTDCFNPLAPESLVFFGVVFLVLILFIITLLKIK